MLYLVTNRKLAIGKDFYGIIQEAVLGGVDAIILREKYMQNDELLHTAERIKEIIEDTKAQLIINGNQDVAKMINADGLHMSYKDYISCKAELEYRGMIGVSVHNVEEAIYAQSYGASYLLAGHVFETACKKDLKPRGIKFIQDIKKNINIPLIAIGGIDLNNISEVLESGADGVAVMSSIMQAQQPRKITRQLCEAIKKFYDTK